MEGRGEHALEKMGKGSYLHNCGGGQGQEDVQSAMLTELAGLLLAAGRGGEGLRFGNRSVILLGAVVLLQANNAG